MHEYAENMEGLNGKICLLLFVTTRSQASGKRRKLKISVKMMGQSLGKINVHGVGQYVDGYRIVEQQTCLFFCGKLSGVVICYSE